MPPRKGPKQDNSRCFVLIHPEDVVVPFCRLQVTSPGCGVAHLPAHEPQQAALAGTLHVHADTTIEFWQTKMFTADTPLVNVFNIPLLTQFVIFPVIFRVTTHDPELVCTSGKLKKMLCEHLLQSLDCQYSLDEDELAEDDGGEDIEPCSIEPTLDQGGKDEDDPDDMVDTDEDEEGDDIGVDLGADDVDDEDDFDDDV